MSNGMKTYIIIATIVCIFLYFGVFDLFGPFVTICMWLTFVGAPLIFVKQAKEEEKKQKEEIEKVNKMSEYEKIKYYENKKKEEENNEIDYTIIISSDDRKSLGSAVVRGAIGGAVLGPVGMIGGALSGKNKSKTTFTVVYKSGRKEVVTVDNDSYEFKKYAEYIKV